MELMNSNKNKLKTLISFNFHHVLWLFYYEMEDCNYLVDEKVFFFFFSKLSCIGCLIGEKVDESK